MNHGPDDKGPEGSGPRPDDSGSTGDGPEALDGPDPLGSDELALRRLLHSAVDGIEPSTGTLDHLRRAVPARRARKRQALVGAAAAALFIGTAVPALVHVSYAGGSDPNTAMAGQSSQAQSGTSHGKDKGDDKSGPKDTGAATAKPDKTPGKHGEKDKGGHTGGGSTGGVNPPATAAPGVTPCTAAQLGSATGTADAPDTTGVVYGVFRVVNVSGTACTLGGPGTVTPTALGAADPAKIVSARHVAGDAAAALPDPSQEVSGLILQPGAAYQEKFAFVPSETCPTTGDGSTGGTETGEPTPDPTPTQGGTDAAGGTTDPGASVGTTPQLVTEDGTADGSILLTHTAAPGSPTATATVSGACAGTVYYTGVLAGT
ncbi:hypothetical protein ACIQVT_29690 [Streptomyces sp. NPDC100445]|uniref:hypothetical protein n=1 Tax=Streptomyces sp. NPDC100445 TaxID=3366102 RepID=UPI003811DEBE